MSREHQGNKGLRHRAHPKLAVERGLSPSRPGNPCYSHHYNDLLWYPYGLAAGIGQTGDRVQEVSTLNRWIKDDILT